MDRLGWAATSTFRVGEYLVGVRSDSDVTDALVRRLLAGSLVEGPVAPPNYSLILSSPNGDGQRGLSQVFRSSTAVVRTRRRRRALLGLLSWLHGHLPADGSLLHLQAMATVGPQGAALAPWTLISSLEKLQPRLHRRGVQVLDAYGARLDLATGDLVVTEPPLAFDPAVLAEVEDDQRSSGRELPPVPPGRYPVRGWAHWPQPQGGGTRAACLAQATSLLVNRAQVDPQQALTGLARVLAGTETIQLERYDTGAISDDIAAAVGA